MAHSIKYEEELIADELYDRMVIESLDAVFDEKDCVPVNEDQMARIAELVEDVCIDDNCDCCGHLSCYGVCIE